MGRQNGNSLVASQFDFDHVPPNCRLRNSHPVEVADLFRQRALPQVKTILAGRLRGEAQQTYPRFTQRRNETGSRLDSGEPHEGRQPERRHEAHRIRGNPLGGELLNPRYLGRQSTL